MQIKSIEAHEILASGGFPTLETTITLDNDITGTASVPYGASAGSHEAVVLTDKDPQRFRGHGMLQAVCNINEALQHLLQGFNPLDQRGIDQKMKELDGTPAKSRLGGNALLSVSLAAARAAAKAVNQPLYRYLVDTFHTSPDLKHLPHPMVVVIEGGKHADHTTDLQEFCFTALGSHNVAKNIQTIWETYHCLEDILKHENLSVNVGNEGAFAPSGIPHNESPFGYMLEAIKQAGYTAGTDLGISLDAAATEFFQDNQYHLSLENRSLSAAELINYYAAWFDKYPLVTVEDMLSEDDWDHWPVLNQLCQEKNIDLIGDDLTVTNSERLQKAIELKAISALIIKPNQVGTLTETIDCCLLAKQHGLKTITSHRGGGETNDTFITDLAVAVGSKYLKVGPTRGERITKYNRLMAIERELGQS